MESSSLVKVGLLGGAAYLAYRYFYSPSAAATVVSTSTAVAASSGIPPVSLDAIYSKMVAAAAQEGVGADGAGVDAWNVYLIRGGGQSPAPAPEDVFGDAIAGDKRQMKLAAAEYWGKMAPYLKARGGYAGLGFFGYLCRGGGCV